MAEYNSISGIPKNVNGITLDYVRSILKDDKIDSFSIKKSSFKQILHFNFCLTVFYKTTNNDFLSKKYFLKLYCSENTEFTKFMRYHYRECLFYKHVKSEKYQNKKYFILPKMIYFNWDYDENSMILVTNYLRDSGFKHEKFDFEKGTTLERGKQAMLALGEIHSTFWNHSYAKSYDCLDFACYKNLYGAPNLSTYILCFIENYGNVLKERYFTFYEKYLMNITKDNVKESLLSKEITSILEETCSKDEFEKTGVTLCHFDFTRRNLLFHKTNRRVAVLHWYDYCKGSLLCCAFNVAKFICSSLSVENALSFREELITTYCKEMKHFTTLENFKSYYRKAVFYCLVDLMILVFSSKDSQNATYRDQLFEKTMSQVNDVLFGTEFSSTATSSSANDEENYKKRKFSELKY